MTIPTKGRTLPRAAIAVCAIGAAALIAAYFSMRSGGESKAGLLVTTQGPPLHLLDSPRALRTIAFEDGQGRKRALSDFRGRVVLLNVWATWCVPCREEMPALDRLQQNFGGPGFEVLALAIDAGGAAAVKRFYEEIGIRALAVYVDRTMRASGDLAVVGVPTTLLIDRDGREIGRRTGPAPWDKPETVRWIAAYANATAKP